MGTPARGLALAFLAALAASAHASKPQYAVTYTERANTTALLARLQAAGFSMSSHFDGRRTVVVRPLGSGTNSTAHLEALRAAPGVPRVVAEQTAAAAAEAPNLSREYVAMCLVVRDQHADLLEWMEHYLKLGVSRIYVYDHGSHPPVIPVFAHLVQAGVVTYRWVSSKMIAAMTPKFSHSNGHVNAQAWAYRECLAKYRTRHQWMAFYDSDELLLLRDRSQDLPALLRAYEPYGALAVNWRMFGSSGHLTRPNGTVLQSYWKCFNSTTVKVIVNTRYATFPLDPHTFSYTHDKYAVNEDFVRVDGHSTGNFSDTKVVLNHYVIKSLAEFTAKSLRGSGDGLGKPLSFMKAVDNSATESCTDGSALMAGRAWRPSGGGWLQRLG